MKYKDDFVKRALKFSVGIIRFTELFPNKRQFWIISDQLIRSACSVGANMKEANSASSKKDYINFYSYALKSANETVYWLDLIKEILDNSTIDKLISEANELARILAASIITMKKSQIK
jgi:four helix bundle protein